MDPVLITLFSVLIIGLVLSLHIGAAIGLAVLAAIWVGDLEPALFSQKLYSVFNSFPLLALPFFVCAGDIMQRGSMAGALLKLSRTLVGHITGGLSLVSVLTCLFYGSLCGSPPATVAAVGGIMIPAMEKEGYPKSFATAVNTASGTLGALIPPSTALIIYGATAGVSISDLFIAIIVPGCILGVAFMILGTAISGVRGYGIKTSRANFKERMEALWEAKWALMVPVLVLGGIYTGITTPTEAGVVAVVYALFAETFITKTMTWKKLVEIFSSTVHTTGMMFFVITAATAMGTILVYFNADTVVADMLSGVTTNKYVLIFLVCTLIIILGTFMETVALIMIMTPILLPMMVNSGMTPVHFGVVMTFGVILGNITPPVGMNLYVGCGISGISFALLSRAIMPFIAVMIGCFYLISYVPAFSTCLL
ncbi:TRAP transporter large permease [uncultured Mailhella sp.]|uniref:TRAP transporter large permease n=1 Tax=uncultured Mailhella sp. TaxID=1981031 RepID=UPI0025DC45C8|nr:TRAP transporter large permease [uncultured Mailhella sp.]